MNILRKTPRIALILAILAILWFVIAMFGAKFGLIDKLFAFGTMTIGWGMFIVGLVGVVALVGLVVSLVMKPRRGFLSAALALMVPLGFFGGLAALQSKVQSVPYIYDITTNTADAPQFSQAIVDARGDGSNPLIDFGKPLGDYEKWAGNEDLAQVTSAQLIAEGYPDLETLEIDRSPEDAITAIKDAMEMRGFENVTVDADAGMVEGTSVVFWFGFEDDVVARVRATETGSSIDFRSTSRVGTSDLGVNAERIADLGQAVKDRLDKDFPKMEPVEIETPAPENTADG